MVQPGREAGGRKLQGPLETKVGWPLASGAACQGGWHRKAFAAGAAPVLVQTSASATASVSVLPVPMSGLGFYNR